MCHICGLYVAKYSLVDVNMTVDNHHFVMGKLTISTGPFSIAMLNYQRVSLIYDILYQIWST